MKYLQLRIRDDKINRYNACEIRITFVTTFVIITTHESLKPLKALKPLKIN